MEASSPPFQTGSTATLVAPEPGGELFDGSSFDTSPRFDGHASDKLTVAFAGSVSFEAGDPQGIDLFERLKLGQDVELRVEGLVSQKAGRFARSDNDDETITGRVTVKVETVYFPSAPES